MNKTSNYQLNQWERTDRVLMDDFNADNTKIDAALAGLAASKADTSALNALSQTVAGKARVAAGSYTGDGSTSRTISVGFTPKAVLVMTSQGKSDLYSGSGNRTFGGLAVTGRPVILKETAGYVCVEIVSGGFRVYQKEYVANVTYSSCNSASLSYHYLAVG